jgi:hypothetical protein
MWKFLSTALVFSLFIHTCIAQLNVNSTLCDCRISRSSFNNCLILNYGSYCTEGSEFAGELDLIFKSQVNRVNYGPNVIINNPYLPIQQSQQCKNIYYNFGCTIASSE